MRYNKRAILIKVETIETPLGLEEVETKHTVPCTRPQNTSFEEQTTLYGQVVNESIKLHFMKDYEGYERVEYPPKSDKYYNIKQRVPFKRKGVLYLSRNSHG